MYDFDYRAPEGVAEALELLAQSEDAKLLAGGHTLLPAMKQRLAAPSLLIDLRNIAELRGISCEGDRLCIGAMETHHDVATNPVVQAALPGFAALAAMIGDLHVRHRGTIGGSVANNDPAADYAAGLLALDATIVTTTREIDGQDFFCGLFTTALEEGEILTHILLPVDRQFGYAKFANPASRYAIAGVAVSRGGDGVRVAVTGAGADGVFRWTEAEAALDADFSVAALDGLVPDPAGINDDMHASSDYRAALVGEMAKRAVSEAIRFSR